MPFRALLLLFLALPAFGNWQQQEHTSSQSLWLQISPQGQELFNRDLLAVLEGSGVKVRERNFPRLELSAEHTLDLMAVSQEMQPESKSALAQLTEELRKWIFNLELANPRLAAEILNLNYEANIEKLSLRILGQNADLDGLWARLEIEIPQIQIRADKIRLRDLNNPWLGTAGLQQVSARLGQNHEPLSLSSDLLIRLRPSGTFDLEIGSLNTNLSRLKADLNLSPILELPQIEISINGRSHTLNPTPMVDFIRNQKTAITAALQKCLELSLRENLPRWFTSSAAQLSRKTPEQALPVPAPGAPSNLPWDQQHFLLGFFPEKLERLGDGTLRVSATSFIEDPLPSTPPKNRPPRRIATVPHFSDSMRHDFALAIHPSMINRLLYLSHLRGYFDNIRLSDGSSIALFESPIFSVSERSATGTMRIRLALKKATGGGLQRLFVSKDVLLKFDGFVEVYRNADSSFSLALHSVDLSSLSVDDRSATLGLFKGLVKSRVTEELLAFSKTLQKTPLMLAAQVRPPENLLGLKWELTRLTTEPRSGFITAYFAFQDSKAADAPPSLLDQNSEPEGTLLKLRQNWNPRQQPPVPKPWELREPALHPTGS
ncbi:MAG: hypothetical protein RJB38_710 [Pseudomonadota bacterium]|jgi:hypothetical protein